MAVDWDAPVVPLERVAFRKDLRRLRRENVLLRAQLRNIENEVLPAVAASSDLLALALDLLAQTTGRTRADVFDTLVFSLQTTRAVAA